MEEEFSEYYDALKTSSLQVKKEELFISVKDMFDEMIALCQMDGINPQTFFMDEAKKMAKENMNDDNFYLSLLLYIENIKNALGTYLESKENN